MSRAKDAALSVLWAPLAGLVLVGMAVARRQPRCQAAAVVMVEHPSGVTASVGDLVRCELRPHPPSVLHQRGYGFDVVTWSS